jgi:hypothetical protein
VVGRSASVNTLRPGGDWPELLDAALADADISVVEVDGRVAMARDAGHLVADIEPVGGAGDGEPAVLVRGALVTRGGLVADERRAAVEGERLGRPSTQRAVGVREMIDRLCPVRCRFFERTKPALPSLPLLRSPGRVTRRSYDALAARKMLPLEERDPTRHPRRSARLPDHASEVPHRVASSQSRSSMASRCTRAGRDASAKADTRGDSSCTVAQ